jgi:hypothetical protein
MSISNKALAIIGGGAALIVVPAGVAFGMVAAHDAFRLGITERAPARAGQQDDSGMMRGGMFGGSDRAGNGDQTQARDGSVCDGDGPRGRVGDGAERGPGMMGGREPGANGGSGRRNR